jgi:hypothetical protein
MNFNLKSNRCGLKTLPISRQLPFRQSLPIFSAPVVFLAGIPLPLGIIKNQHG